MKKSLLFLPFLLLLVGAFISCEEVEEAGKYDNWRERGEAFVALCPSLYTTRKNLKTPNIRKRKC